MKSKAYLIENNITITQAAKELHVSRPYLSLVVNEKIVPGRKLADRIQVWSHEKILSIELLGLTSNNPTIFTRIKQFLKRGELNDNEHT